MTAGRTACNTPEPISMRLLLLAFAVLLAPPTPAVEVGTPLRFSKTHADGEHYMQVRLLGALAIDTHARVDGYALRQLSGLAWDAGRSLLYALSDDGYLAHLVPSFEAGMLRGLDFVAAYPLLEADGTPVREDRADSEGLAIVAGARGDAELLVTFEVAHRLARYTPEGRLLGELQLPAPLGDGHVYRGGNSGLESVTAHPELGILVAPEKRLRGDKGATIPIFALDGRRWGYAPLDPEHSAVVELETDASGRVLVLERRYKSMFSTVIFSVRRLALPQIPGSAPPPVEDIARFDSNGDFRIDNFEGLARHEQGRYFMVSDDNRSAIQRTVLVYLEIL